MLAGTIGSLVAQELSPECAQYLNEIFEVGMSSAQIHHKDIAQLFACHRVPNAMLSRRLSR